MDVLHSCKVASFGALPWKLWEITLRILFTMDHPMRCCNLALQTSTMEANSRTTTSLRLKWTWYAGFTNSIVSNLFILWKFCHWYYYITAQDNQFADISWWPTQSTFMASGLNVGYWSPDCEAWFQSRAKEIKEGTASVKNTGQWAATMKFKKPRTLRFVSNQELIATNFLLAPESLFLHQ